MNTINHDSPWHMAGTEGTGDYRVVMRSACGRVGVRQYSPNRFRVRVEPTPKAGDLSAAFPSWKQPGEGGQERFSTTVVGEAAMQAAVRQAVRALCAGGAIEINAASFDWATAMVENAEREELVGVARALKLPGANGAVKWLLSTLRGKVAAAIVVPETEEQERQRLVSKVRALKLPGANGAARWTLNTLRFKTGAA